MRFPGLGVAGRRLALVILLGGCSKLTNPPPVSYDGGHDVAAPDGAGQEETGRTSDGAGASRTDGASLVVVDAKLADVVVGAGDDAGGTLPGLDAAGGFAGAAGTGDAGGATVETDDASPASPDTEIADGGASQVDGLAGVDLAAGNDRSEFLADGPGEDAGTDSSVPDASGADTIGQPDVVRTLLTVNAGADKTICSGWSATLGAQAQGGTPPYTYAWSANPSCGDCLTTPASAQPLVTPPATTTFTVTAHDMLSAVATDSVIIKVVNVIADAGPDVSVDPAAPVRIGTPALPGYTYVWGCDRPTCALSSTTTAQPTVNPSLSTTYTVAVTSPEGCAASDSTTVWANLLVSTTPVDGEMFFPDSASLLVQFGSGVLASSITADTLLLRESATGTPVRFTSLYNSSLHVLTITPTGGNYNATLANFTLTLVGGAAGIVSDDVARPQRLPDDISIRFTLTATPDFAAPTIVFRSPAPSSNGVATNTSVVVSYSKTLDPATLSLTVANGPTNLAGTLSYDAMTSTITFVPAAPLANLTTYTARVSGIRDLSGNAVGFTPGWNFTTGTAADTARPTVTAVSPSSGATRASAATSVDITFSEPVAPATLVDAIQVVAGANPVAGKVTYDSATQIATFTPSGLLGSQTLYTVTVVGVKDLAGNAMNAAFTSTFTTAKILLADSFESGTANWTWPQASAWGLTTDRYVSANHSLTDSPDGNYLPGLDTSATSISIDVTGLASVSFGYWLSGQTQPSPGGDVFRADYSISGGTSWPNLANHSGTLNWTHYSYNIVLPAGTTALQVRFRFTSGPNQQFDGMYVDDVIVQAL